jgi:hypothetical protein
MDKGSGARDKRVLGLRSVCESVLDRKSEMRSKRGDDGDHKINNVQQSDSNREEIGDAFDQKPQVNIVNGSLQRRTSTRKCKLNVFATRSTRRLTLAALSQCQLAFKSLSHRLFRFVCLLPVVELRAKKRERERATN